ncbi:hypothetical protein BKA67DRAFT_558865 [Truncatella angustata]|uniref:Protein kinase domain-containing protein n=1 Tax=Truncatella angustata TaxID=152316 RepID=A0A9P8UV29_9PEZI|nr:uncharacterized protein BKA67DRAFT_558865 [Truncatella angustata]KAH6658734.1 hypothetical protein BKA67DRAFT_558865 [Truncatella angustata]
MRGVKYLHEAKVAHCDLNPENLLFTPPGDLNTTDFGFASIWSNQEAAESSYCQEFVGLHRISRQRSTLIAYIVGEIYQRSSSREWL